jgi:tetratricopeptide (TPR) repeat protein
MANKNMNRIRLVAVLLVAGLLIWGGHSIMQYRSGQADAYNQAMIAMEAGDAKAAMELLDASLAAYDAEARAPWWHHAAYGRPSNEIAALAHFHKAGLLLEQAQKEKRPGLIGIAVDEYEEALRLNPGAPFVDGTNPATATRLDREALDTKHNLDLLFRQQKGQEGEGNQPGKPGDQSGPPQQAPGSQPGPGTNTSNGSDL